MENLGAPCGLLDPAGVRETEFAWGGAGRRKFTNLAPCATDNMNPHQEMKSTGSTSVAPDSPWVWLVDSRREALRATEFDWPQVAGEPLRGKATYQPAVPPSPQAAVQQPIPGLETGWERFTGARKPVVDRSGSIGLPALCSALWPSGIIGGIVALKTVCWPGKFTSAGPSPPAFWPSSPSFWPCTILSSKRT